MTNSGNIDLTNVTVTDSRIGNLTGPIQSINNDSILETGENWTYTRNYTVTRADITNNDGNGLVNNATVNCDQLGPKNDTVKVPIDPYCSIEKTVTDVAGQGPGGNVTAAGDIVSYHLNVTNSGNIDLTNVTVTDPLIGNLTGPIQSISNDTVLNAGESWTYTGNYTVTRADITINDGDGLVNNATINCDQLGPKNDTVQIPIDTTGSIDEIVTDVAGQGPGGNVTAAGDVISYQVNVTNGGKTDLTNVTVTDSLTNLMGPTSSINNDTILNAGETWTYNGNYTVTQTDINNNGTVEADINNNGTVKGWLVGNIATFGTAVSELDKGTAASGTAGKGFIKNTVTFNCDQLGPKSHSTKVPIERNPHYSILKSVIGPDEDGDCIVNSPGDEIPYRIVVCNDGNVDLTGISVNDPMISLTGPTGDINELEVLNPGESWVYDGIYELTQDDINNGKGNLDNTATVNSNELPEESSYVSQPIEQRVDLSIQKSIAGIDEAGDFMINNPGDVINYQIAVENNGDVDLQNVHVTDSLIDDLSGPTGDRTDPGVLNPGELWVYTGDYIVTQADIDSNGDGSGFITNTATVDCNEHSSESSSMIVPIIHTSNFGTDTNSGSNHPVADFSTSVTSGYAPLSVQFTDKSTESPTSWSWDFNNDGVADSSTQNPVYTYNTPGTYVAKLTVSNANGIDSKPATINVLQATGSGGGGSSHSSGGSSGSANVVGSSSGSTDTRATANVIQPENNTSGLDQNDGNKEANVVQTPELKATSTPAKKSTKTPGFEIMFGITALLGAVFLCKRK